MNPSLQQEETLAAADPFAADIFAAPPSPSLEETGASEDIPAETKVEKSNLWLRQLPKVSRESVGWDNLFRGLPSEFSDELPLRLAESLTRFLILPDDKKIEFLFLIKREINRAEEFPAENQNSLWLTPGVEAAGDARIAFEIDSAFAAWLVDAALGAEEGSADGADLRRLTPSELSVIEFLALNLTNEANRILRSPIFRFRAVSSEIPDWLQHKFDSETSATSLLTLNYQTIHGLLPSIIKIYLTPEALRALQPGENFLLNNRPARPSLKNLQNRIKDARTRLSLGSAELSFAEIAGLEAGDVILLENHDLYINGENLTGRAEILFGAGENARAAGELTYADFPFSAEAIEQSGARGDNKIPVRRINLNSALQIRIDGFVKEENQATPENFMTETDENLIGEEPQPTAENADEQAAGGGLAVENLAVSLRVELDARRLSLTEVGNLRENQVLELGIRPTDGVNLLIDSQTIGRGELVAVGEDRLGVRITKLLR